MYGVLAKLEPTSVDTRRGHNDNTNETQNKRPDLRVTFEPASLLGAQSHFIDVKVGEPLAPSYAHLTADKGESLPNHLEDLKAVAYRQWMRDNFPGHRFWPFGVSTYGHLGANASSFLISVRDYAKENRYPFNLHYWHARIAKVCFEFISSTYCKWAEKVSGAVNWSQRSTPDRLDFAAAAEYAV